MSKRTKVEQTIEEKIAYTSAKFEKRTTLRVLRDDRVILIEQGFTGDELESEYLALMTESLYEEPVFEKYWFSRINLDRFIDDTLRLQEAANISAERAVFEMMVDSVIDYVKLGNKARYDSRY